MIDETQKLWEHVTTLFPVIHHENENANYDPQLSVRRQVWTPVHKEGVKHWLFYERIMLLIGTSLYALILRNFKYLPHCNCERIDNTMKVKVIVLSSNILKCMQNAAAVAAGMNKTVTQ